MPALSLPRAFRRISVLLVSLLVVSTAPVLTGTAWAVCTTPSAPRSVTASPGNASANVSWLAPTSNGGCTINKYTVVSLPVTTTKTNTGQLSLNFTGLTNGTSYQFKVSATNTGNFTSAYSTYSSAVVPRTVPGAPTNVSAVPGNGSATVSWTAPTSNGGSAITGYTIYPVPGNPVSVGNVTSAPVTGLTNGTSYTFTVKAQNVAGLGAASAASAAVTPRTVPQPPTNVTAVPGNTSALVSWTAPTDNGGSAITGYKVTASTGGTTNVTGATQTTVTGLANDYPVTFTVKATNVAGDSVASAPSAVIRPVDGSPSAPTNVVASVASAHSATVTWTAPSNNGNSAVTGYVVAASPGGKSVSVSGAGTLTGTVGGLLSGVSYTFVVLAKNSWGYSAESVASNAVTLSSGPGAATNVVADLPTQTTARVTWTAAPPNGATITGYRVTAAPGGACAQTTGATTAVFGNGSLVPGTTYVFSVIAKTSGSSGSCFENEYDGPRSASSNSLTTTGMAPWNYRTVAGAALDGAVQVRWEPGDVPVTSYVITANPGGISRTVSGKAVAAVLAGLTNGVTYSVTVTQYNAVGSHVSNVMSLMPSERLVPDMETLLPTVRAGQSDVSDDGRYVAWVEGGSGEETEPWLHDALLADRQEQVVYLIGGEGSLGLNPHDSIQISGDGQFVAFSASQSQTSDDFNNVADVYVLDRSTDIVTLVSKSTAGEIGNGTTNVSDITPDGRYVLLSSMAANLVSGDSNNGLDLFVRDRTGGTTTRASLSETGNQMYAVTPTAFISGDGRYVAGSEYPSAFWRDLTSAVTRHVSAPYSTFLDNVYGLSRDGMVITFEGLTYSLEEGRLGGAMFDHYRSIYQQDMSGSSSPYVVSVADNGYDIRDAFGSAVSPSGELVLLWNNFDTVMVDLDRGRTSLLIDGSYAGQYANSRAAIAANERTVSIEFEDSYPDQEMRVIEFLRDGAGFGSVWYAGWRQHVNTMTGDFTDNVTDASVAAVGPALDVVRSYDSGNPANGWFGTGTTSPWEARLTASATSVIVTSGDGMRELFTNGGVAGSTYTAPKSSASKLVKNGDGTYTLTRRDMSTATFTAGGKLSALTDPQGHRTLLTYTAGKVSLITDEVSGRALHLTWTGAHVTRVETDTVAAHGGPLPWTYGYTGDLLTSVCAPPEPDLDTRCTTYEYSGGKRTGSFNAYGERTSQVSYYADGRVQTSAVDGAQASTYTYPQPAVTLIEDARDKTTRHEYDQAGRLAREVDPLGYATAFTYDVRGWPATVTDPNGTVTTTVYSTTGDKQSDATGYNPNVAGSAAKTAYLGYDTSHNVLTSRDRRSSSSTDAAFLTTYTYDSRNNVTSETGPPVPGFPSGVTKSWTYSAGTETAIGGGTVPVGLRLTSTDARNKTTAYRYDRFGNVKEVENPAGLVVRSDFDELGRLTATTEVSAQYPAGVTTTYTPDELGRVVVETGPATTDAVTTAAHRLRTTTTFDRAGRLTRTVKADIAGTDPARTTDFGVDAIGRVTSVTDSQTNEAETYDFDAVGNLEQYTDRLGRVTDITYTDRNERYQVIRRAVTDVNGLNAHDVTLATYAYDNAGRLQTDTDVLGRVHRHDYDTLNRATAITLLGWNDPNVTPIVTRDIVEQRVSYDAAGNVVESWRGSDLLHETFVVDAMNLVRTHVLDPGTGKLNRTTTSTYDAGGLETLRTLSDGTRTETVTRTFDALGKPESEVVENGTPDLTTWFDYDDRGLLKSTTDARGAAAGDVAYTTDRTYDENRRLVSVALPSVATYTVAGGTGTARPTTTFGYNTFGEQVRERDQRGSVTVTTFDGLGRQTRRDYPSYVMPSDSATLAPYETWTYDNASVLRSHRDRRGGISDYGYDGLDHLRRTDLPTVAGGRPQWQYAVDDAGNVTAQTDPIGAVVEYVYDKLDRVAKQTDVLRPAGGGTAVRADTKFTYDDLDNISKRVDPSTSAWNFEHDPTGALTKVIDPLSKNTTYTYDVAGRPTGEKDPLLRRSELVYDLAGRRTEENHYDAGNALLTHATTGYDKAGNVVSTTSARGYTTNRTVDGANRLSQLVEPVTATTWRTNGFEYDAGGLLTRSTDGRGFDTAASPARVSTAFDVLYTYNTWGLPESVIEPSTTAHPAAADRTYTTSYDEEGNTLAERRPGIDVTRVYDGLGRLTSEHGQAAPGAPAVTAADKTFGYDLASRLTTVGHPAGNLGYTYDDRGLMLTATGTAGATTVVRDTSGRPTSIADPAGTHTYTWTSRDELNIETDPLTGVAIDHDYDDAGQPSLDKLGATGGKRRFGFDSLGRLYSSEVEYANGLVQASYQYQYDEDGNVTQESIFAAGGVPGAGGTYTYDRAGRLESWNGPAGLVSYGWDRADNRTSAGAATFTYDERSRLTSGPAGAYTWTPRGTLASRGATTFVADALDRVITAAGTAYTYDSLDRVTNTGFAYTGQRTDPTKTPATTLSRAPAGGVSVISTGGVASFVTLNRHGDIATKYNSAGTIAATKSYEPFGGTSTSTGSIGDVGFQADFTNTTAGLVWMGARWYDPAAGIFTARDTMARHEGARKLLNRYGYGDANPVTLSDPDGHCAARSTGWGGCSLDAGPSSYDVTYLVARYMDSSVPFNVAPPPAPENEAADADGLDPLFDPDPEVRMVARLEGGIHGRGYAMLGNSDPISRFIGDAWDRSKQTLKTICSFAPVCGTVMDAVDCLRGDLVSCASILPVIKAWKLLRKASSARSAKNIWEGKRAAAKAKKANKPGKKPAEPSKSPPSHADEASSTARGAGHADEAAATADNAGERAHQLERGSESNQRAAQGADDLEDLARAHAKEVRGNPTMVSAARDRRTGKIYYGQSGKVPAPEDIDPVLRERMPDPSLEDWPAGNCAEFNACNIALKDGAKIDDLEYATVYRRSGLPKIPCRNCEAALEDADYVGTAEQ